VLKIAKRSLLATIITLFMGLIASFFVPTSINMADLGIDPPQASPQKPYYTKEELERNNKEAEDRWRRAVKRLSEQSKSQFYQRERLASAWFTWIPWLILPFFLNMRPQWIEMTALGIPLLTTIVEILHPYELASILVAFLLGEILKYFRYKETYDQ
jgi:hypothetical protein